MSDRERVVPQSRFERFGYGFVLLSGDGRVEVRPTTGALALTGMVIALMGAVVGAAVVASILQGRPVGRGHVIGGLLASLFLFLGCAMAWAREGLVIDPRRAVFSTTSRGLLGCDSVERPLRDVAAVRVVRRFNTSRSGARWQHHVELVLADGVELPVGEPMSARLAGRVARELSRCASLPIEFRRTEPREAA